MPLQSTSTPGVGTSYTPPTAGSAAQGDPPPTSAEAHAGADGAAAGEAYYRVSQAVQRAAAARHATQSSRGPARTLSLEEELFIRLHHGCQG